MGGTRTTLRASLPGMFCRPPVPFAIFVLVKKAAACSVALLLSWCCLLAYAQGNAPGPSVGPRIAILAPLSGVAPTFGISTRNGALLAIDEWNAQGGVLGRKISAIVEDSQCGADAAVNAADKVVTLDRVRYLIGEVCSKASIPISEITNAAKVIQISPASTHPGVTVDQYGATKPYSFPACFIDPFQGRVGAVFAYSKLHARKAFLIFDQGNTVNLVARQAKELGIAIPFLGGDGWDSPDLDLKAADGDYYTNHYSPDDPRPEVREFLKAYGTAYKDDHGRPIVPDSLATLAYDATNLLLQGIQAAGADDTEKVRVALEKTTFNAASGRIVYDAQHNPIKGAVILHIQNGKVVFDSFVLP